MADLAPSPVVLRLDGITKRFGLLVANEGVDLELRRGEVLALLGENGAGKTTLMNILFGHYVADEGTVSVAGADGTLRPLPPGSPHAALAAGIGMVHQHFTLAENLTGLENIMLGTEPVLRLRKRTGAARRKVEAASTSTSRSRGSRWASASGSRSSRRCTATPASSSSTSRRRC